LLHDRRAARRRDLTDGVDDGNGAGGRFGDHGGDVIGGDRINSQEAGHEGPGGLEPRVQVWREREDDLPRVGGGRRRRGQGLVPRLDRDAPTVSAAPGGTGDPHSNTGSSAIGPNDSAVLTVGANLGERVPHRNRRPLAERRPVWLSVGKVAEQDDAAVRLGHPVEQAARHGEGRVEICGPVALRGAVEHRPRGPEVGRRCQGNAGRGTGEHDGDGVSFARRGEKLRTAFLRAVEARGAAEQRPHAHRVVEDDDERHGRSVGA